jgi:hypothetical protein
MFLSKFHIIWPSCFRGKAVLKIEQEFTSRHHLSSTDDVKFSISVIGIDYIVNIVKNNKNSNID